MSRSAVSLDTLASFLPRWVRRNISDTPHRVPPLRREMSGAAIFVDIAGFTTMTDAMGRNGVAGGAERLSRLLDTYFGLLIQTCYAHRGDVAAFVGDAMLAIWPGDPSEMALHASRCALDLMAAVDAADFGEGERLRQRVSVGAGGFDAWELGTPDRRLTMLRGGVLEQLGRSLAHAQPGQICVAPEVVLLQPQRIVGTDFAHGRLLSAVEGELEPPIKVALPRSYVGPGDMLRAYVAPVVARRLDAGLPPRDGEFRTVTAVFVSLAAVPEDRLQDVVVALLEVNRQQGGHVSQLLHDEKGTTLVLAFGVPLLAHEDDAARAVHAGLRAREVLEELGAHGAVGIATGRLFCGAYGSEQRRHYDCIGTAMNLASRLMTSGGGRILCDAATVKSIRGGQGVRFEAAGVLTVKGRDAPVPVYVPGRSERRARQRREIIGRDAERELLRRSVEAWKAGGTAPHLRMDGEPGIGKSVLLADMVEELRQQGIHVVTGSASALEQATPLATWRSLWRSLVDADPRYAKDAERRDPRYLLEGEMGRSEGRRTMPPMESGSMERRTLTPFSDGTPQDRIYSLLRRPAGLPPLLVAIDDATWIDASSLELVRSASERIPGLGLLLCGTPDSHTEGWKNWKILRLGNLSQSESEALVCRRLSVGEIPPQVRDFVWSRAEGQPFFTEELADALRDEGVVAIEDGECLLLDPHALQRIAFPSSVEGMTTARIDALSPGAQQVLQVATVLGRYFRLASLEHLLELPHAKVSHLLEELLHSNLLALDSVVPEPIYSFRHAIVQDVAYNQLLFAARRRYHQRAAEWMESVTAEGDPGLYTLLAHHWSRAPDPARAMLGMERAGLHALEAQALAEAQSFFGDALTLAARASDQARMHLQLGNIALRMRDPTRAHTHLSSALHLRGEQRDHWMRLLRGGLRALAPSRSAAAAPVGVDLSGIHLSLAELAWLELDRTGLWRHSLCALDLATSPEADALARAMLSQIWAQTGWAGPLKTQRRLALGQSLSDLKVASKTHFWLAQAALATGEGGLDLLNHVITLAADDPLLLGAARVHSALDCLLQGQPAEASGRLEALDYLPESSIVLLEPLSLVVRLGCDQLAGGPELEEVDELEQRLLRPMPRMDRILALAAVAGALKEQRSPAPARRHAELALEQLLAGTMLTWPLIWAVEQVIQVLGDLPERRAALLRLAQRMGRSIPRAVAWRMYWEANLVAGLGRRLRLAKAAWAQAGSQPLLRGRAARLCCELMGPDHPEYSRFATDAAHLESACRGLLPPSG